jgi:hypothetical protein
MGALPGEMLFQPFNLQSVSAAFAGTSVLVIIGRATKIAATIFIALLHDHLIWAQPARG